jgi:hypothetical protein
MELALVFACKCLLDACVCAIQDLPVAALFKHGERHGRAVDFTLFAEAWQPPPEHGIDSWHL